MEEFGEGMDKILVVDDEKINLMMVNKILNSEYEVLQASSGEEALEILENVVPTIVLLDVHMDGIDGYEVIKSMKKQERLEKVPVIFLTADDDSASEVRVFELGADDFIKKPFISAVVKRRVERSIENFKLKCKLQDEVMEQTKKAELRRKKLQLLSIELVETLVSTIDAKDIYTKGHSARVAEYSVMLAKKLGWDDDRREQLHYKALLHDIGKIGVPDRVLNKDGRLTEEEYELMKGHTTIGSNLLQGISSFSDIYQVARSHHERYDGNGYPDRLTGKDIPEEARLVGILDAYDAMSSDRVYRKALPREIIRQELIKGKGTQFDPDMLDCFLEMFDADEIKLSSSEVDTKDINDDIEDIVKSIIRENISNGALIMTSDEMKKIYNYIQNIHKRYGFDYSTALITLTWDGDIAEEEIDKAMKAMEYSVVQSLRKVDISSRVSHSQILLVLTEAKEKNLKMILDRIFTGFYKNYLGAKIKPIYEIK